MHKKLKRTIKDSSIKLIQKKALYFCADAAREGLLSLSSVQDQRMQESAMYDPIPDLAPAWFSLHFLSALKKASAALLDAHHIAGHMLPDAAHLPQGLKIIFLTQQASLKTTKAQGLLFACLASHIEHSEDKSSQKEPHKDRLRDTFISQAKLALTERKEAIDCLVAAGHTSDRSGSASDSWFTFLELMLCVYQHQEEAKKEDLLTARALAARGLYEVGQAAQSGGQTSSEQTIESLMLGAALWRNWLGYIDPQSKEQEESLLMPSRTLESNEPISQAIESWCVNLLSPNFK